MRYFLAIVTFVALVSFVGNVFADDSAQMQRILRRLDALEKENAYLKGRVAALERGQVAVVEEGDVVVEEAYLEVDQTEVEGTGFFVNADYLYMTIDEGGQDYVITQYMAGPMLMGPGGTIEQVEADWDSGFRVGFGYRLPYDGWEANARYTRFHTENDDTTTDANNELQAVLVHPDWWAAVVNNFDFARATLKHKYDQVDIELGRRSKISENLSVRLFGGLQYTGIQRKLRAQYERTWTGAQTIVDSNMDMDAFGLRVGADTDWNITPKLSIYTNASGSLLSGKFKYKFSEENYNPNYTTYDLNEKLHQVVPALQLAAGITYSTALNNSLDLSLSVGYEFTKFFNFPISRFVDDVVDGTIVDSSKDFGLHGLVARGRLDF